MIRRILVAGSFFAFLIALWQLAVTQRWVNTFLVPSPVAVFEYLVVAISDHTLPQALAITFERLILGYVIGIVLGVPLGLLSAFVPMVRDTLGVLALGMQTLPSVCWIPLALLWFGQSESSMLFVVVMGCLWAVMLATQDGVRNVPPIYSKVARTMGSRGLHTWLFVSLPAALPAVIGGMKHGWAFAWRSLMAAEIYVTVIGAFGLGHLLHYGRELHAMEQVVAVMIVIIIGGYAVDRILFAPFERFLHRRWGLNG